MGSAGAATPGNPATQEEGRSRVARVFCALAWYLSLATSCFRKHGQTKHFHRPEVVPRPPFCIPSESFIRRLQLHCRTGNLGSHWANMEKLTSFSSCRSDMGWCTGRRGGLRWGSVHRGTQGPRGRSYLHTGLQKVGSYQRLLKLDRQCFHAHVVGGKKSSSQPVARGAMRRPERTLTGGGTGTCRSAILLDQGPPCCRGVVLS